MTSVQHNKLTGLPGWPFLGTISKNHIWFHTGHTKTSYMILLWLPRSPYMILIWHPRFQVYFFCSRSTFNQSTRHLNLSTQYFMVKWYHIWFFMVLIWVLQDHTRSILGQSIFHWTQLFFFKITLVRKDQTSVVSQLSTFTTASRITFFLTMSSVNQEYCVNKNKNQVQYLTCWS